VSFVSAMVYRPTSLPVMPVAASQSGLCGGVDIQTEATKRVSGHLNLNPFPRPDNSLSCLISFLVDVSFAGNESREDPIDTTISLKMWKQTSQNRETAQNMKQLATSLRNQEELHSCPSVN
jgi:hypothetical protein